MSVMEQRCRGRGLGCAALPARGVVMLPLLVALELAAVMSLAGCGSTPKPDSNATQTATAQSKSSTKSAKGAKPPKAGAQANATDGGGGTPKSSSVPLQQVPRRDSRPVAETVRDRLANNGLEIRRWTILDSSDRVMTVLSQHADGAAADATAVDRLRRNGLRFIRVPADQVEKIVNDLGGALMDRTEWHGQVYEWRSLNEQPVDSRGTAIAIDGRVRRFDRGDFRLLFRSWTVMMEDNPYLHLEMLPQHRLPQSNNLRALIGQKPEDAGEAFAGMALDLQLQAGFAYVLASELPSVKWPNLDKPAPPPALAGENGDAAGNKAAGDDAPRSVASGANGADVNNGVTGGGAGVRPPAVRPHVGPDEPIGPAGGAPRTLGEVLLPVSISPPTRELLVLVPRIPQELFPPVYESDLSVRRAAPSGNGQ